MRRLERLPHLSYAQREEFLSIDSNTCQGDSGGAALDQQGRLIGTLSRGGRDPNNPNNQCYSSIHTSVASWATWIRQTGQRASQLGGYATPAWVTGGSSVSDQDFDGIEDDADNCPTLSNADQRDFDNDNIGDVCDDDIDGDGVDNNADNCPNDHNPGQEDNDNDNYGDACDDDDDNDGYVDTDDNCPRVKNSDQTDTDSDGTGDACDDDDDGDGVLDANDVLPARRLGCLPERGQQHLAGQQCLAGQQQRRGQQLLAGRRRR